MLRSGWGRSRGLGLSLCAAIWLAASAAPAQEPSARTKRAVRELVADGENLFNAGDCTQALDRFRRAYALMPAPTVALREARCLVKLGRLIEGVEKYEEARRGESTPNPPIAFLKAAHEAKIAIADLRGRIPKLKLTVTGPGADSPELVVFIDKERVPSALLGVEQPVDPGNHTLLAAVGETSSAMQSASFAERKSHVITLELRPGPLPVPLPSPAGAAKSGADPGGAPTASDGSAQRTGGWIALGAGGVGLGLGIVSGILALNGKSSLDEICAPPGPDGSRACPSSAENDLSTFRTERTLSYVGFAVGAVGIGVGVSLLLTAPSDGEVPAPPAATLVPWIGLGAAGLRGTF